MYSPRDFSHAAYARHVMRRGLGDLWQWYQLTQVQTWTVLVLLAGLLLMPDDDLNSLQAWISYVLLAGNAVGPLIAHLLLAPGRMYRDLAKAVQTEAIS